MTKQTPSSISAARTSEREARLAQALRENLRRRKAQTRARDAESETGDRPGAPVQPHGRDGER